MKALGVDALPADHPSAAARWHCEIKFDGYRAIAVINQGVARLLSRTERPLDYPELTPALENLGCRNAVIDGEIVALDSKGRSDFQILQGRDLGKRPPMVYFVFDLLHLDDESFLSQPIEARRAALARLVKKPGRTLQLSPNFDVPPKVLLAAAKREGLEGIVLKRKGSLYESDRRSGAWLKIKNLNEQEFVIGGFTPPKNSREHFGAILVGYHEGRGLHYAGKVGTGFDAKLLRSLHALFLKHRADSCPFANLPFSRRSRYGSGMTRSAMREVVWLQPRLVAQIKFAEWTQDGMLRQPVFLGMRDDKPAGLIRREPAAGRSPR